MINFSFELYEFDEALTPYGTIETGSPARSDISITDFTTGEHFRTGPEDITNSLALELEDRLITLVLDESGSMTWNDVNADRHTYLRRLITKLRDTYPGTMTANLVSFGGTLITSELLITKASSDFLSSGEGQNLNQLLQETFQDSVYDFAGVRVVRRTDRFPSHPADGVIVGEGIFNAAKDDDLTEGQIYYYGVWTFNKDKHFSQGKFVSGTPYDRILPRGVNFATATARILPGVTRDAVTQVLYNFVERDGSTVFDSSGNGHHGILGSQVIEENFWLGDAFAVSAAIVPVGVRFDGEFDILTADVGDEIATHGDGGLFLTVNFWVYRYANTKDVWIIGTGKDEVNANIGWAYTISDAGEVQVQVGDLNGARNAFPSTFGPNFIPLETWTMVTTVWGADNVSLYVNGILISALGSSPSFGVFNTTGQSKLYIGGFETDDTVTWTGGDLFGSLANISIHNTIRSTSWIFNAFATETLIFDQSLQGAAEAPVDNGQREVLISWTIENDFDFAGGTVKVIRKYREIPTHPDDGVEILNQAASAGQFFFLDVFDFINNADYYYQIYTFNALGNPCDRIEARMLSVHIPASINPVSLDLSPVSDVTIIEGNRKVMLQWSNPTDDNTWQGTKIYYGPEKFPTISIAPQGDLEISNGFEIFDTADQEFFVHRKVGVDNDGIAIPLTNSKFHYYTLITYDRVGQLSDAVFIVGTPSSQLATIFPPSEVKDLHITIVNPRTLSVQWSSPLIKSDNLELFFGESALIFVSIRDIFGGGLDDLVNISLQVCTDVTNRELSTKEISLGVLGPGDALDGPCGTPNVVLINGGCRHGARLDENCNNEQEDAETILSFTTVSSGLIKGVLTHTPDASILTRRERYEMSVRAKYVVENPETGQNLFEFNTEGVSVSFQHPLDISIINKNNRHVTPPCGSIGKIRGQTICPDNCDGGIASGSSCNPPPVNGTHINASQPYLIRVELQYKGESLPAGTPVAVQLFKHTENNILTTKSNRVSMREGTYNTDAAQEPLLDFSGNPTGDVVGKSFVDIEVPSPSLPDIVDVYISIDYLGFFLDGIHTVTFIDSLFIQIEAGQPIANGIDVAEQFATVWTIDPDNPDNPSSTVPVPDGTLVKWELVKLRHGRNRPFYSSEPINELISGIYSSTINGVARNVFFGPVNNVKSHSEQVCGSSCCIGEEYAIKASVILGEETAVDQVYAAFPCIEDEELFFNRKFFMNAAEGQTGQSPNYIAWADGEHLLKFQIAQHPALILDSEIPGASCFRDCINNNFNSQLFSFPDDHVVQITAPGEIVWDVTFGAITETGTDDVSLLETTANILSSNSVAPLEGRHTATAAIPISGTVTDFYVRFNKFVGDRNNPQPEDCQQSGGGAGNGGGGNRLLSCEWENICKDSNCSPTSGIKWTGVNQVSGTSTLLSDNIAVTLTGGGGYDQGMPPILVGLKEPLSVDIIEARINGQRMDTQNLLVDGISQHSMVVEVKFANLPVPAGTPVELRVEGPDANIVQLSNCVAPPPPPGCAPGAAGVIYADLVNDQFINPTGNKRSLAYFSINPLPNIAFNAKVFVTCRYDKLGTAEREITRCVELNNTVNVETPDPEFIELPDTEPPPATTVASNESIVYDTVADLYSTTVASNINRIAHFAASNELGTTANIFLLGGYTDHDLDGGTKLTATAEKFDVASSVWSFITDMPTARAAGQTVVVGNVIYCIGGLELDPTTQRFVVSRQIESYDTVTGLWNPSLKPMPKAPPGRSAAYGVAFGDAQYDEVDNIYVLCGVNSVVNNNQPDVLNDRVLRYSISTDTWTIIRPLDLPLYQRIAPFGFYRDNPLPLITVMGNKINDPSLQAGYIYSGSSPRSLAEINAEFNDQLNRALNDFRSFILTSPYYLSLTSSEQISFIETEEEQITNSIVVPPYVYHASGFKYIMGSEHFDSSNELIIDIADKIDNEWTVLPKVRDRGQAVYISYQDAVYFMGGSNQNQSTTLNRVETIDFNNEANTFLQLTSFSRGRSLFSAVPVQDDIYFAGGLTSGHTAGYVKIELLQGPTLIEAQGNQSSGLVVILRDDAGEILDATVRLLIRGRIRISEVDDILTDFVAGRGADRALGGDGSGNAPDIPSPGDEIDFGQLIEAQNKITDPNSDEFQFNAAKQLGEQIFLFPVLYSEQEIIITSGIGGVTLLPRSEDPLADFQKLSLFINETLKGTPPDPNERFQGNLTRDELVALGDALQTVTLPPVILDSNTTRILYDIETVVTVIDDFYFGQTVSDFDLNIQEEINQKIEEILTPPDPVDPGDPVDSGDSDEVIFGGVPVSDSECFLLQHVAAHEISPADQPPPVNTNGGSGGPGGTGGQNQSGQCLFCKALLPLSPSIQLQLPTAIASFYNSNDWVPQIKKRLTNGSTLTEILEELDIIDHETPFGASQLYSAMKEAAIITTGEVFESQKKVFYIVSDNSENFSLISRDDAIEEINAVDGDGNSPVIYTVFSTSFPQSLAAQLERTEVGDIEKIVEATGGQSSTLISSGFLDQILNQTINGATGGLGWGRYNRILNLGELSAITEVTSSFVLPVNTQGFLRFRYSQDGFNFTDWTERFEGSQTVDFVDFFASLVEFEIVLTTGFSSGITEEYDSTPTGIPKLTEILWETSSEKIDFLFLDSEEVLQNVQQMAASFDGLIPSASQIEIGVASSNSHDWRDFQTSARPAMGEFGKTFLIERTDDPFSLVPTESLTTRDGLFYTTTYGAWDPTSTASLFRVNSDKTETPVLTGFRFYPRDGALYFNARQNPNTTFKLTVVNSNKMRVGLRLRNRLHTDSIAVSGVGYIYSTNDEKPIELSQVAPRAINVFISPQNPDSNDVINALYSYIDLNGDPESGTLIKWFKNGEQLHEINNSTNWSNRELQTNNKLEPQDKIYFTVTPSDGRDFGTTEFSPTVTITALPPNAQNLIVIAIRKGITSDRFETGNTYRVQYDFEIDDAGDKSAEKNTLIRWFVNGLLFKKGTFSEEDTFTKEGQLDPRELVPTEVGQERDTAGSSANVIGNEIIVEVTPKTALVTGETTLSSPFSVVNTVPIVTKVTIAPAAPDTDSELRLSWSIEDYDLDVPDPTQSDQSEIQWFTSADGENWLKVAGNVNVPDFDTETGEYWKAEVTGFDGLDLGPTTTSNIVRISAVAP